MGSNHFEGGVNRSDLDKVQNKNRTIFHEYGI